MHTYTRPAGSEKKDEVVRVMRRRKESDDLMLMLRMGIPLLFPAKFPLTS
jgi:hypothetical protein